MCILINILRVEKKQINAPKRDMFMDAPTIGTYSMYIRFEVFTAVTMKNGVFLDVTPCGCCKNRRFGGT
jgi:hypothetical protein